MTRERGGASKRPALTATQGPQRNGDSRCATFGQNCPRPGVVGDMNINMRTAVGLLSATALGWSGLTGTLSAFGDGHHNGNTQFRSTLAPAILSDPPIHGVVRGGVPWQLDSGQVRLRHDGRLSVDIRGLLVLGTGNTGPVHSVSASLFCGADTTPAAMTAAVPLSSSGDARIDARVDLPSKCLAPSVLINPNGNAAAYIAASGFSA
jgi:hypothetical protein